MRSTWTIMTMIAVLMSGCQERVASGRGDGLALIPYDSVQLRETGKEFLGAPAYFIVDASGDYYISDPMNGYVLQFGRQGKFIRQFGSPGRGPGEFRTPLTLGFVGDSLLATTDWGNHRLSIFDLKTGSFQRSVAIEGIPFWMQVKNGRVWLGNVSQARRTSLAVWIPTEDTIHYMGPLPAEYLSVPLLAESHPYASMLELGNKVLVGFTGHHALFITRPDGTVMDTVEIPAVRRRGVPRDLVDHYRKPISDQDIAALGSSLMALHEMPSKEVAAAYMDVSFVDNLTTAEAYVSVLSPDLKSACVDVPLHFGKDGRPTIAFRGDTVYTLEQRVQSATTSTTMIRSYVIDTSRCDWMPVQKN